MVKLIRYGIGLGLLPFVTFFWLFPALGIVASSETASVFLAATALFLVMNAGAEATLEQFSFGVSSDVIGRVLREYVAWAIVFIVVVYGVAAIFDSIAVVSFWRLLGLTVVYPFVRQFIEDKLENAVKDEEKSK